MALAILQEGDKLIMHYGSFNLNELELSNNQTQLLVETAFREHKKYNLPTKYLTLESMTLEWEKSLKAANTLIDSFEQQITRSTHSRVDFLRHRSRSQFFEVIERNIFLLKRDKNSAKKFRESFSSVNGKEVRCALVAKVRDKLLEVRGGQQTEFHQLAALGLEKRNFNIESNI
ncbi:hypothetical protein [Vibrio neptunius]|uniref:hypothetical protein n=1 Tax=Vibrio neptunius TaxID=170651 RepID=UPI0039E9C3D2